MKRELMRTNDKNEWCTIQIELRSAGSPPNHLNEDELSVTAWYGVIATEAKAEADAIEVWESLFESNKEELGRMAIEHGTRTPRDAAMKVVEIDGKYHGLDVCKREDGKVFIVEGGGCAHDVLAKWFPEAAHWFRWHLNCMNAACEHQEAMGWKTCPGYHKPGESCPAPKVPLPQARVWTCDRAWDDGCGNSTQLAARATKYIKKPVRRVVFDDPNGIWPRPKELPKRGEKCRQRTWIGVAGALGSGICPSCGQAGTKSTPAMPWALAHALGRYGSDGRCEYDALGAPCPTCGYAYGTSWLARKLPTQVHAEVLDFINTGTLPKETPCQA